LRGKRHHAGKGGCKAIESQHGQTFHHLRHLGAGRERQKQRNIEIP
jgi:hypothetical protein